LDPQLGQLSGLAPPGFQSWRQVAKPHRRHQQDLDRNGQLCLPGPASSIPIADSQAHQCRRQHQEGADIAGIVELAKPRSVAFGKAALIRCEAAHDRSQTVELRGLDAHMMPGDCH
jgi:hypothetical protein